MYDCSPIQAAGARSSQLMLLGLYRYIYMASHACALECHDIVHTLEAVSIPAGYPVIQRCQYYYFVNAYVGTLKNIVDQSGLLISRWQQVSIRCHRMTLFPESHSLPW